MKSMMQYIQGQRKGKEAHRLEKEAMKDPFLSDALDGYQAVEGSHVESIEAMRRRISRRTRSRRDSITKWSIAASLLICFGFGSYFWLNKETGLPEQAQSMAVIEEKAIPLEQAPPAAAPKAAAPVASAPAAAPTASAPVAAAPAAVAAAPTAAPAPVEILSIVEDAAPIADTATESIAESVAEVKIAPRALTRSAVLHAPRPVIGEEAFREYLKKELVHPQDSACKDITGTVLIEFHINEQGRPVNLSVKQSLCESADKEALRLIEKGPDWEGDMGVVTVPVVFNP